MSVLKFFPDKNLISPPLTEVLRYMGAKNTEDGQTVALAEAALSELKDLSSFRVCYRICPITLSGDELDFGFMKTGSSSLKKLLCGSEKVVIFAATIGIEADRLISKYGRISPSKSLAYDGAGSALIEALCDNFCEFIKESLPSPENTLTPRFSPGYGNLSLEFQEKIFSCLDCPKNIGLTLTDSFMMVPSKSVTAISGIGGQTTVKNCKNCNLVNSCKYRKEE